MVKRYKLLACFVPLLLFLQLVLRNWKFAGMTSAYWFWLLDVGLRRMSFADFFYPCAANTEQSCCDEIASDLCETCSEFGVVPEC